MAAVGVVGAAATVVDAIVVRAVVQPGTDVSDKMFSYPFTSGAFVVASLVNALLHALVLVGVVAFVRGGAAGTGRAARVGAGLVLGGLGLLTAAELASIAVRGDRIAGAGVTAVILCFSVATVLLAAGSIVLAVTSRRAGRWAGWRRNTPLGVAVTVFALFSAPSPDLLPIGVALWSLALVGLCAATYTDPTPAAPAPSAARRGAAPEVRLP